MNRKLLTWLGLSLRLFKREFGRGELTIIALAIILAVTSVMALSSITDRVQASIMVKSAEFLAADRDLVSSRELPAEFITHAESKGIATDRHIYFQSMAFSGEKMKLAVVKAVTESYPLRGNFYIKPATTEPSGDIVDFALEPKQATAPNKGEIWLSQRIFYALGQKSAIEIGEATFKVAGLIDAEPDAPFQVFDSGTRVIMNHADVPSTNVIQPGSRITYANLYAGDEKALKDFEQWLKPQLKKNQRFRGVKEGAAGITRSLERAESFLMLAGVIGVLLAATAVAVSARLYSQRHLDSIAIMKTLGASVQQVQIIYLFQLFLIALVSVIFGTLLGYGLQSLALFMLADYLPDSLPAIGAKPFLMALITGFACALMFSVPSLLKLFRVPPMRVLRRTLGNDVTSSLFAKIIMGATTLVLVYVYSNNLKLTGIVALAAVVLSILIIGISRLLVWSARRLSQYSNSSSIKLACASLQRRATENNAQIIGFTLAITLILVLYSLQNSIIQEWQEQMPEGAPNHFIINIAQHEIERVEQRFAENDIHPEQFYPIIRGRLTQINDEVLKQRRNNESEQAEQGRTSQVPPEDSDGAKYKGKSESQEDETNANNNSEVNDDNRRGIGRELNLTFTHQLPDNNEIVAGEWLSKDAKGQVSVEKKIAERLQLKLGDELTFLIGSQSVSATVTSFRTVDWNSLQPNFYMIFSEDVVNGFPATYITSFYLSAEKKLWLNDLLQEFPTISLIDIDAMLKQVQNVIKQVSVAIQFILLVVVLAATLVLIAQVQSSLDERHKETVIYRTIGARGKMIKNAIAYEFIFLGGLAGFIAATVADFSLYLMQTYVFKMTWSLHTELWLIGILSGAIFVAIVGVISTRSLLKISPSELIRQLS